MASERSEKPGHAAQALAKRECQTILRALALGKHPNAAVHRGRKAIRRLRALLALIEPRFDTMESADRSLQRLGDSLSRLRDAHVATEIAQSMADLDGAPEWKPMIDHLTRRRDDQFAQALVKDPGFERRRATVRTVAETLDGLEWSKLNDKALLKAVKAGHARVDKAEKRGKADPSAENCHRFRRRLRKLRMQLEALKIVAPDLAKVGKALPRSDSVKSLRKATDRLGRRQDVRSLQALVRAAAGVSHRDDVLAQLRTELKKQ